MEDDKFWTEFMEGFDQGTKDGCAKLQSNELWQEFLSEVEREIIYGKGRNYPKLDIKAMYKTAGR